jgi:diketogulonate reductase-like aldo/keto reductase
MSSRPKRTVRTWLRLGGRMVDCAQNYLNEVSQTVQSEKGNEQSLSHRTQIKGSINYKKNQKKWKSGASWVTVSIL